MKTMISISLLLMSFSALAQNSCHTYSVYEADQAIKSFEKYLNSKKQILPKGWELAEVTACVGKPSYLNYKLIWERGQCDFYYNPATRAVSQGSCQF